MGGVGALTIAVLQNRLLATDHKNMIDRELVFLFGFFVVFCSADMIWGVLTSRLLIISQVLYTVSSYSFHLGAAFSAFFWSGYLLAYLHEDGKRRKIHNIFRSVLIVVQLTVLISNLWNRKFFWVDEEAYYHSYVLRNFMFFMQFAYYIVWIVYIAAELVRNRKTPQENFDRRRHVTAMIFCLVPLVFGFGQMLWPDAPMYSLGFMLTSVLIYSINVTAEREDFISTLYKSENDILTDLVAGLSYDCDIVYHVNLDTAGYTTHTKPGSRLGRDTAASTGDFFRDTVITANHYVAAEDQDYLIHMLSREYIQKELKDKQTYSFNFVVALGNEERHYLAKVVRTNLNDSGDETQTGRNIIVGLFDDDDRVREEVRQKEVLRQALRTAENASRAKSDFLFNMSHDIRTPMNAILGFTTLAKHHIDDREVLTDCLDKVAASGQHLLSLINDVLDMSRIESGKMSVNAEAESVVAISEELIAIVQELSDNKGLTFTHDFINVRNEFVLCDALRLKQVILNVLSNAVKYTKEGGKVSYTVEQLPSEKPELVALRFVVADTGIGMSPEFLSKIFNEFEREQTATASGVEGTGLGMSITKNLVDMMGGEINISSVQGEGTTVECLFTFEEAKRTAPEQETEESTNDALPAGKRILLVDDNELNREIAIELLEELGLEIEEAENGKAAIEKLTAAGAGYYDAVLMDVQMPVMDGYEATKRIRALPEKELASIPIVAMTANAFEEDKNNAYAAGMNAHLAKPIDMNAVITTLNRFLR